MSRARGCDHASEQSVKGSGQAQINIVSGICVGSQHVQLDLRHHCTCVQMEISATPADNGGHRA
eukprot:scaffold268527_cov36-Tisochrysis_lutea.AAC.2